MLFPFFLLKKRLRSNKIISTEPTKMSLAGHLVQFWCIFLDPKNKKNPL